MHKFLAIINLKRLPVFILTQSRIRDAYKQGQLRMVGKTGVLISESATCLIYYKDVRIVVYRQYAFAV